MSGSALWTESGRVARGIAPFARNHRVTLGKVGLAAVLVVAARVALPWPLRAATDHWIRGSTGEAPLPAGLDPIVGMGLAFVAILFLFGYADHLLRLYAARFAIGVVRDLRRKTFRYAIGARKGSRGPADLVARLVGDTARIKSGIAGFLVHVVTSSLVILGVSTVLFLMNAALGLIFLSALLATLAITYVGASALLRQGLKQRRKEGRIAEAIHETLSSESKAKAVRSTTQFQRINNKSGSTEATLTRVEGRTTWATFTVFGFAVFAAIAVGTGEVQSGRIGTSDMVLFLLYALMMRAPMVMLARHGSRLGKTVAGSHRVLEVLADSKRTMKARKQRRRAKAEKRQRRAEKSQAELEMVALHAMSEHLRDRPANTPVEPTGREGVP